MAQAPEYTPDMIAKLEATWGAGFLSPGGPGEVAAIVRGTDLTGLHVLDVGTGLGGPAICLVAEHGAAQVTSIDVEQPVVEEARRRIAEAGLAAQIDVRHVLAGPLTFADDAFDVVFSKDSIIHIPDKAAFYADALRVLRPGGWLALSDWFGSTDALTPDMRAYLDGPLHFELSAIETAARHVEAAGFDEVEAIDRNDWFVAHTASELAWMEGDGRNTLADAIGGQASQAWIERTRLRLKVAEQGQLRPGHLRARKPGRRAI